jgi:hypothetical protein
MQQESSQDSFTKLRLSETWHANAESSVAKDRRRSVSKDRRRSMSKERRHSVSKERPLQWEDLEWLDEYCNHRSDSTLLDELKEFENKEIKPAVWACLMKARLRLFAPYLVRKAMWHRMGMFQHWAHLWKM